MSSNVIFFGWNRSIPGREQMSAEHFQEFLGYLGGLQQAGAIDSFEPVLLSPHGGDLNGFFLIRGDNEALNALQASDEWLTHQTRGGQHLEECLRRLGDSVGLSVLQAGVELSAFHCRLPLSLVVSAAQYSGEHGVERGQWRCRGWHKVFQRS